MDKIIKYKDIIINKTFNEINRMLEEIKEDEIKVYLLKEDLLIILNEFYDYYERKNIIFSFNETMINHFSDILDNIDDEDELNLFYVLKSLRFYELVESRIEVSPNDTKKIINKIYYKCMRSESDEQ